MKTVVITGASTGIGAGAARHLAANGWRVFAGVRKQADGEALTQGASGDLRPILLDVTKPDQVEAAAETVSAARPSNRTPQQSRDAIEHTTSPTRPACSPHRTLTRWPSGIGGSIRVAVVVSRSSTTIWIAVSGWRGETLLVPTAGAAASVAAAGGDSVSAGTGGASSTRGGHVRSSWPSTCARAIAAKSRVSLRR